MTQMTGEKVAFDQHFDDFAGVKKNKLLFQLAIVY